LNPAGRRPRQTIGVDRRGEVARRVLVCALLGTAVGGFLSALTFLIGALTDGTGLAEAFGYSLVVAVIGAFLGGVAGLIVGLGDMGTFGGALVGLLVALAVVGFYVVAFSRPGQYGYFLSQSRVIIAGLTAPLVLTGTATALLKNKIAHL